MAVEIPVVIDIEKAFQDAARNVNTSIKPLQREVSQNALELEIKIGIDENGDAITSTFREIKEGSIHELSTLQTAISDVRMEMIAAAKAGDQAKFTALLEAKVYMEDMVRASQTLQLEMDGVAKTMSGLNARMSAARENFNNTRINSAEWRAAVKEIQKVTAEMDKAQKKVSEMGTKAGSIDRLSLKISELREKWDAMSRAQKFDKDGNLKASAKKVVEQYQKLTDEAARFGKSLEVTAREASAQTKKLEQNVRNVNHEMDRSESKLAMLVKNSIRLVAIHSSATFVRNIREVTAEFELQRVALGSIIQDTEKANSLFKQIKAAAVESPFEIKDLVTYTKQLSAYQIETDKLFDTTKKLADISSGLGVDMGRLILAFGQVRAAAVLRGQELRQFTEAGIPLVDKLAEKFSVLNGRAVTTAEVFELISKRAVPFSMIEEIFDDLTSAGGAFYRMQEKQAETLLGQWNNLKDSISIMYDEIGNTKVVHSAMESLISDAKTLMQNWRSVASVLKVVGVSYASVKVASLFLPVLATNTKMLEKAEIAEARAAQLSNAAHRSGNKILDLSAKSTKAYAYYTLRAARSATQWGRAVNTIKAALTGNWMALVVSALTLVIAKFISARKEANRLNEELSKIEGEGVTKMEQSIRNFEKLANAATSAVDGSKQQRDAVDELVRTYGDLLPPSDKVIEKLREMNGEYSAVTDAIRQKINMQIQEQKIDEITSDFGKKVGNKRGDLKKILKDRGLSGEEIAGIMDEIQNAVQSGLITVEMNVEDQARAIENIIKNYTGKYIKLTESVYSAVSGNSGQQIYQGERSTKLSRTFSNLIELYSKMSEKIREVEDDMTDSTGVMGVYAKEWKDLQQTISELPITGDTKFAEDESRIRNYVTKTIEFIQNKFKEYGIDISEAIASGTPDFDILDKMVETIKDTGARGSLRSILKDFKKQYENFVPDDAIIDMVKSKFKEISVSTGISMDKFTAYIKRAGQDNKEYLQELGESIEKFRDDAVSLEKTMAAYPKADTARNRAKVKEYNEMAETLQVIYDLLKAIIPLQSGGSGSAYRQDPFIQQMQDRIKFMQDFKKGYDDLNKYLSSTESLSRQQGIMEARGLSLGIDPARQRMAAKDLSKWYSDAIDEAFAAAKAHGAQGNLPEEFLRQQISDTSDRGKALKDFQKLIQSLWDAKTDFDTSEMIKQFNDALKKIEDEVKRSETARNFYKNILDLTGDEELAATMGVSVYGGIGKDFKDRMQAQLNEALGTLDASEMTEDLRKAFASQDFSTILANLDKFPEEWRSILKQMASDNEKYNADWVTDIVKTYQKTKTYEERITDVHKKEEQKRKEISESTTLTPEQKTTYLAASAEKEAQEVAKIRLEAMKDTYTWTKAFEDLEGVSSRTLRNLISLIDEYIDKYGKDLEPQQLRELARQRENAKQQLNSRDAYKATGDAIKDLIAARKRANDLQEEGKEESEDYTMALDDEREAIKRLADALAEIESEINEVIDSTKDLVSVFASDDDASFLGGQLDNLSKTISGIKKAGTGIAQIATGQITPQAIIQTITGLADVVSGIFSSINAAKMRTINKQIEHQQDLLDALEYSYDRLDKAIAKAFGSDYIYNYNKQLENLAAQQAAYEEQARLEREKGKKADEDKIKDYENSARETADEIMGMRGQLAEFFTGTDLTAAATDFANAWIDAYKEFGSTTDAMKEKFNEMIQNMITQSLGAKIMQSILQPLFKEIDDMAAEGGELSAQEIANIANMAPEYINKVNAAMTDLMNSLTAAGYNVRQQVGSFTGISRDIAGASEESINGLAAGINTQNFYMSLISQNVASILAAMTGETVQGATGAAVPDPYKETMLNCVGSLPQMRDDMNAIRTMLQRVIQTVNGVGYVSVRM